MNTFKRKALTAAVLGTVGVAGSAHAIYQDPSGLGEALVYPYYTVNSVAGNSWWTFVSVTNTTTSVKVVKVRFREGKNSAEVLDFNLYLSPNDMWTGAVLPASADASSPAHLVTNDASCTNPPIPAGGVDFRNYSYSGGSADGLADTLDRTREGYIEIFEMGNLSPTAGPGTAAVHNSSGVPSCTGLTGPSLAGTVGAAMSGIAGGLMGAGTLINVNSGRDAIYNATAFSAWQTTFTDYQDIGNLLPAWSDTFPAASAVMTSTNAYFSTFNNSTFTALAGDNAFISTIMHTDVLNEYVLDTASASNTDWVVTFPDKNVFITSTTADIPFTNVLTTSGACETIGVNYFNREEAQQAPAGVDFSPTPPGASANSMCWESTVVSFRNGTTHAPTSPAVPSLVLGSANVTTIGLKTTFQNGWADINFTGANAAAGLVPAAQTAYDNTGAASAGSNFFGLPTLGFMIRTFDNGNLTCGTATCQGNYGAIENHSWRHTP